MTLTIRRSSDRGHADHGWLDARHSFSFASYYDPSNMGFRALRVLNEDRIAGGQGFSSHPHKDMEIISVVIEGALEHKDSMGTGSVIRPGDVQVMSAGTGVVHSEFNGLQDGSTHLLQIWVIPAAPGGAPRYEEQHFDTSIEDGQLTRIVSGTPGDGALTIQRDVTLERGQFAPGETATTTLAPGRFGWVQVIRGSVTVDGETLSAGDGASVEGASKLAFAAGDEGADILVFDLD